MLLLTTRMFILRTALIPSSKPNWVKMYELILFQKKNLFEGGPIHFESLNLALLSVAKADMSSSPRRLNASQSWGASSPMSSRLNSPQRRQITVRIVHNFSPSLSFGKQTFCFFALIFPLRPTPTPVHI